MINFGALQPLGDLIDSIGRDKFAEAAISEGTVQGQNYSIGYEHGPSVQAGILTNQHIIEKMFQDIMINGTDPMVAAQKAEKELNSLLEAVITK
ncbi:hypothetical protein NMV45_01050 [Pasteurella multocida]|nr:hypothetical protein [Pasteurella multocida]MDY0487536.1 hypothetical protein [Pasteurella multocida]MDY0594115.1 hypothetical protein [Pasteurella multocida]MDY0663617.1 hypothetical protein [Pasteurella multocida]MDY0665715.1 hypothetical protein [Pasteurella multocida]